MTLDEWAQLPEDEAGEFVDDGYLTEDEVPDPAHELTVVWLGALLLDWLRGRGGFVFGSISTSCGAREIDRLAPEP